MADPAMELSDLTAFLNVSCGKIAFDGKEKVMETIVMLFCFHSNQKL